MLGHFALALQHLYDLLLAAFSMRCDLDGLLNYFNEEIFQFELDYNTCSRDESKELLKETVIIAEILEGVIGLYIG